MDDNRVRIKVGTLDRIVDRSNVDDTMPTGELPINYNLPSSGQLIGCLDTDKNYLFLGDGVHYIKDLKPITTRTVMGYFDDNTSISKQKTLPYSLAPKGTDALLLASSKPIIFKHNAVEEMVVTSTGVTVRDRLVTPAVKTTSITSDGLLTFESSQSNALFKRPVKIEGNRLLVDKKVTVASEGIDITGDSTFHNSIDVTGAITGASATLTGSGLTTTALTASGAASLLGATFGTAGIDISKPVTIASGNKVLINLSNGNYVKIENNEVFVHYGSNDILHIDTNGKVIVKDLQVTGTLAVANLSVN